MRSGAPAWVRRSAASPEGRRATGTAAAPPGNRDGEGGGLTAWGRALPLAAAGRLVVPLWGACQPRFVVASRLGSSGLGHHEDGKIGVDVAIGRRVELTMVFGRGAGLEAAGAVPAA